MRHLNGANKCNGYGSLVRATQVSVSVNIKCVDPSIGRGAPSFHNVVNSD